jgi:hypothetical protein
MIQPSGDGALRGKSIAPEPTEDGLLVLADLTLAEYLRYLAGYGGTLLERDGLLLVAGAHRQPNPYRNGALRLDTTLSAQEVLARAGSFFGARKCGYALWARAHADADLEQLAAQAGLRELERLPELALTQLPEHRPPPEGVGLRQAIDERSRHDYLALVANAWGMAAMPHDVAARVFFDPDSLDVANVAAFVAYYDDAPVSAAMMYVSHGVALACQGATIRRPAPGQRLPHPDRSGHTRSLAATCACAALELSFEALGATISLGQTSRLGAPVWEGLGYREFTSYARYLVPACHAHPSHRTDGRALGDRERP